MKELKQCRLVLVGRGYVASMEDIYIYIYKTVSTKSRIFFRPQLEWVWFKGHVNQSTTERNKLKTTRNLLCFLATFASNNTFIASNQARHQRGEKHWI